MEVSVKEKVKVIVTYSETSLIFQGPRWAVGQGRGIRRMHLFLNGRWVSALGQGFAADRLLGLRVRIPRRV